MNFKILIILLFSLIFVSCEKILLKENTTKSPVTNFEVLWKEFDLNYAYFTYKNVNWDSIYNIYRPLVNENTSDWDLFDILWQMTNHLEDGHVNIISPFARSFYNFHNSPSHTINWIGDERIKSYFEDLTYANNTLLFSKIKGKNIGYIRITTFENSHDEYTYIDNIIEEFNSTMGMIIDLRMNGGGSDANSKAILDRFTDKKRLYRRFRYRYGPNHNDFTDWMDDYIEPSGNYYSKITLVLTNEHCYSSTEDCIMGFKEIPDAIIIGDTTGGGTGNPVQRELPNGWLYRLSNWQMVDSEMNYYEGIGIPPDTVVWISKQDSIDGIDRILETAIDIIDNQ